MTQLLQQAISEIQKLSAPEQDAIAELILEEIADEQRWDESYARSQDKLAALRGQGSQGCCCRPRQKHWDR